jgi:hypothetical protein
LKRRNLLRQLIRSDPTISLDEWAQWFSFNQTSYPFVQTSLGQKAEEIGGDFNGLIQGVYKQNGTVFACMAIRQRLFSQARFQFRQMIDGRPGDLFGTKDLIPLERPWPGGTTGDLLARMISDADLAGNAYVAKRPDGVRRLNPDWVTIILGSRMLPQNPNWALDLQVAGYMFHPGGRGGGEEPIPLAADEVAHFAPIPDPMANFRGMSWLTPVIREILGDQAASSHKLKFFENGATPNLVVSLDPGVDLETFQKWVEKFDEKTEGAANAFKTLYLGGGADAKTIGANMRQVDFKAVQGAGETRIAAAAGVPPVVVGFSEGLAAATYSNYCVPMGTEALTLEGWKHYGELSVGDEVLGYDAEAGVCRWTPIRSLQAPFEAEVVEFGNATWKVRCTPEHAWVGRWASPVSAYEAWAKDQTPTDWGRVETKSFREGFELLRTAPTEDVCSLDIRPAEAAILGWLVTDGSVMRNNPLRRMTTGYIWQKHYRAEVAKTVRNAGLAVETKPMGHVGVVGFKIPAPWLRDLWHRAELDEDDPDWVRFVLALGSEEREAFLDAGMLAEGTNAAQRGSEDGPLGEYGLWYRWRFAQNPGPVMDAFLLAAQMNGYSPQMGDRVDKCQSFYCAKPKLDAKHLKRRGAGHELVWCLETDLGTWTMRQGRTVTLTGNSQARRSFADQTLRVLWGNVAGSLANIINVPGGAELFYDDRDIPFLQEDQADKANIQQTQSQAAKAYVEAGFDPESVKAAIAADDITLLKHTGMTSVQLLPPGTSGNGAAPEGVTPSQASPA